MQPACIDLPVTKSTVRQPLLLMQPLFAYPPIAGIVEDAPLRLSVPAHGLPGDWPVWPEKVIGWSALNLDRTREAGRLARVIDADTIEFNELTANGERITGGRLAYRLPIDLAGCRAELVISPAGLAPIVFSTTAGGLSITGLGRLLLEIAADQSAGFAWESAPYALRITWSDGSEQEYLRGRVLNGGCCHGR